MNTRYIYILFLFIATLVKAETIVVGEVMDAQSGEPIANVNIYYRGTHIGCTSNADGLFMLRADLDKKRTLVVSAIGYKTQRYTIEPEQYVGINITLEEENTHLEDVFVIPKNNPAIPLMERVRLAREANDIARDPTFSYTIEEQKHLFISGINRRHLQRHLWKSLQSGMIPAADSTLLLPLYSLQQQWNKQGKSTSPITAPEEHFSMLTPTDYSLLLNDLEIPFNFYSNTIDIFGKSFLSPLAASGNQYYNYYLVDSLSVGEEKQYYLHFRSKNAFIPTFNGEMTIDSSSCAVRSISATIPRETSVNYLSSFQLAQTYNAKHALENEKMSLILDFAIKSDSSHIFPTVLLMRNLSASGAIDTIIQPLVQKETYTSDSLQRLAMDSLHNMPIMRVARFAAQVINTGDVPTGTPIDIGDITELVQYRQSEGLHLGLPLRTNEKLWKNVSIGGYLAYGFHDRAWKGGGNIQILLPTQRRHILRGSYEDHYVWSEVDYTDQWLRENNLGRKSMNLTMALFNSLYTNPHALNSSVRQREVHISMESDWTNILEGYLDVRLGKMGYGKPSVGYYNMPAYRYSSFTAAFRLGWNERKVDYYFKRLHIHSNYPIVYLAGEVGSYRTNTMEQDALYAKLTLSISQHLNLGLWGELNYAIQSGIIGGNVPYPLLKAFNGNQTYTYEPYRFTLMNQWQYAADKYILLHANWDMNGILFNRIPGIRYLRLHELLELKAAYGDLSSKHSQVLPFPTKVQNLNIPYVELGIGIGNILRVAEVYAVWRLTHWDDKSSPIWGIRFRLHLGL